MKNKNCAVRILDSYVTPSVVVQFAKEITLLSGMLSLEGFFKKKKIRSESLLFENNRTQAKRSSKYC